MPDLKESRWTELWRKEDYWAIWLGFILIIAAMFLYLPKAPKDAKDIIAKSNETLKVEAQRAPFKTLAWYKASDAKKKPRADSDDTGKFLKKFTSKPHGWAANPLHAFYMNKDAASAKEEKGKAKYEKAKEKEENAMAKAKEAEEAAAKAEFKDTALNEAAVTAITAWRAEHRKTSSAKRGATAKPFNQIPYLLGLMVFFMVFFSIGIPFMKETTIPKFMLGFTFVFFIAVLAYTAGNMAVMKKYGIGAEAWAIFFGMLISNTIGTPKWVMPSVKTEYFIKTGLVLLGAEILFGKMLAIGTPGIFVAWVVTPIVLYVTYQFGQRVLKMESKTLNVTISSDMSVCGVSAAIATAAACKAKKEELTLAIGLSLVFTSIMMIVMPAFIKMVGMPQILGGAWMGGTIDSTGAVAAAGAFLGEKALYVAATVKMIQNILIGIIAFFVAIIWTTKIDRKPGEKVSAMEIWYRFPKFVIGFIGASIILSTMYESMGKDMGAVVLDHGVIGGFTKLFRDWMFVLAFSSIGLATNFRELAHYFKGGKPLTLYVCGQSFNLCLTLLMAWIMFYKVFPNITASI